MKKKLIFALTTMSIAAMLVVGCGSSGETGESKELTDSIDSESPADENMSGDASGEANSGDESISSLAILEKAFELYDDDDKPIVVGGDLQNPVDGAPGVYDISDIEGMEATFHITEDSVALVDEAASAVHAMNANTFTSSVFHVKNPADTDSFASSVKESVLATRWMCGFPEKLLIMSVKDEYVVMAFGDGQMLENLKSNVTEAFGNDATVVAEEAIE